MKARELSELSRSLRPCPFCAGPSKLEPMPSARHWWRVRCEGYECGGTTWAAQDATTAVQAWNRRDGSR